MKTFHILLAAGALALSACGSDTPDAPEVDEALKQEILTMDSLANQAENVIEEINESSEELDNLLQDLEN